MSKIRKSKILHAGCVVRKWTGKYVTVCLMMTALFLFLLCLWHLPVFYVKKSFPTAVKPTYRNLEVEGYGVSVFASKTYQDGLNFGGNIYRGPCYVDVVNNGEKIRIRGRELSVKSFFGKNNAFIRTVIEIE